MLRKTDFFRQDLRKAENLGIIKATKEQAIKHGLKFYWPGKECPNGHLTYYYTSSGYCRQCSLDKCAEQYKATDRKEIDNYQQKIRKKIENYKMNKEEDWWGDGK